MAAEAQPITRRSSEAAPSFFDPKLGKMRRYLVAVGPDKNAAQSNSRYAYRPPLNLARLALGGDG